MVLPDLSVLIGLNLVLVVLAVVLFLQYRAKNAHITSVLATEKHRLTAMVASITDGILMLDPGFNLVVTNPAANKLIGSEAALNNLIQSEIRSAIKAAYETDQLVKLPEREINGRSIEILVEPVKDSLGNLIGVVVILHDLTSLKNIEKLREEFTAMMIHELRTPLTTVLYSSNMMLSDVNRLSTTDLGSQLGIIKSTASHLLSLVNDLLDIAKIEAGKFQIVKSREDLSALIEEKISTFTPLATQKRLELIAEIDPKLPALEFDPNRLGQVLDNLIGNSLKYTATGWVVVKARVEGQAVRVEVQDSGDGIEETSLPKLFSKFEQLGKGKTGETKGTGLGLVIVKGIIEAHQGTVWAKSEGLGKGSTFGFSLPLS